MSRPPKCRIVEQEPVATYFKPRGIPMKNLEEKILTVEQLEAVRLCDLEGMGQEDASFKMGVSRQTFGRILTEARKHIAEAIVTGKCLRIEGGHYQLAETTGAEQIASYCCMRQKNKTNNDT
ncbi:MAG: DUF134 domain-containing protein [Dissulfuribacterales bacterium]